MAETMTRNEELLNWRPRLEDIDKPVPREVTDARLSLLSPEDRDVVNRELNSEDRSPRFLYYFCGGKHPDPEGYRKGRNLDPFSVEEFMTAYMCSALTVNPRQAERIMKASAQYEEGKPYLAVITKATESSIRAGRDPVTGKYEKVYVPSLGRTVDKEYLTPDERVSPPASVNRGYSNDGMSR